MEEWYQISYGNKALFHSKKYNFSKYNIWYTIWKLLNQSNFSGFMLLLSNSCFKQFMTVRLTLKFFSNPSRAGRWRKFSCVSSIKGGRLW